MLRVNFVLKLRVLKSNYLSSCRTQMQNSGVEQICHLNTKTSENTSSGTSELGAQLERCEGWRDKDKRETDTVNAQQGRKQGRNKPGTTRQRKQD